MKLESGNEHVVGAQTPPRKSYNPFESDDEDTNGYTKGSINGYDIKSFETSPESLTFHLDSSNLSWEEAILGHSQILSNSMPDDASSEEVLYRKDSELFTDKIVTECELPEVFSYKDNGFQSVKDILIDDGMPTLDKVWIESEDNYESTKLSTIQGLKDNGHGDMLLMEGLKSKADIDVEKDPSAQDTQTEDPVKESGLVHDVLERPYSADRCGTDVSLEVDEFKNYASKKQEEFNIGWRTAGYLVESGGLVNGKRDPLCDKDGVKCPEVENTENEVSKGEHPKDNVPLANGGESFTKPSIISEALDTKDSDERNHAEEFPAKSNEVHHAETTIAKPSMVNEVEATTESSEVNHAGIFSAKPSMVHEVEATTESNGGHLADISPPKPIIMDEVEATLNESRSEEATLVQFVKLPESQEPVGNGVTNSLPYNSKVEDGSIILDFNAAATSLGADKEEISEKNEATVEKPPDAQSMSRDDVGPLHGCNSILDCAADKRVHGETSFSAAMQPPASITYTGPIAYSGNISHRSESSAGSTRSFAFPVLQSEWNSSPVRMAKADQGYFRKQKGWVHSLVCCKF